MREKAKMYSIIGLIVIASMSVAAIVAFFYGRNTKENEIENKSPEITNQIVVDSITNQYFVVSKTVFLDVTSDIKIQENSNWSDFLWKKTIVAEGIVRVDVGVDMEKLEKEDILINDNEKTISITLPKASVLDSSLYSELEVENENGVLVSIKEIFKDGTEDYNLAVKTLTEQALAQVNADSELMGEAEEDSTKIIELILKETGYTVEFSFK